MRRRSIFAAAGLLAALPLLGASVGNPGVVFEITTTDHTTSPASTDVNVLEIEGPNLSMAIDGPDGEGKVIFLGESNELIIEDHANGTYTRIDQAALDQLAGQVNAAMAQLEEMMAGLPEEQREMVMQMQQQAGMEIPGMASGDQPVVEVRASGRSDTRGGYPVSEWEMVEDGQVERRLWVTPWSEIDGGDEARDALTGMVTFFDAFLSAMPPMPGGAMIRNPFSSIDQMGGMPVVTEELAGDGSLEMESEVTGVERRTLGADAFQPDPQLTEQPLPEMGGA